MKTPSVAHNAVANFAGRIWASLMAFIFIPVYVRLIGIESYALIGVFASLSVLISTLDMGLSSTVSRELARLSASSSGENGQEARDLLRTLEVIYWSMCVLIAASLMAAGPLLAHFWLKPSGIPEATVARAIGVMGLVIAGQWPSALYDGALTGMQRQVLLNGLRASIATVQHGGAVLVLWLVSPTVLAYFTWQIVVAVATTIALGLTAWRCLPRSDRRSRFRVGLLRRVWWFAAGMTGISLTSIVLSQTDKIVLARALPLDVFGYYVVASNVATVIVQLVSPFYFALFPRFTQLFAAPREAVDLPALYHFSCQCVAALVIPAAAVVAFFPHELLVLWLRDPAVADRVAPVARLLVIGQALNALVFIPSLVQLAFGWTRLILILNVIDVILLAPVIVVLALRFGAPGGAAAWILLNVGYLFTMIPLMHRRLLPGEMWRWYRNALALPATAAVLVTALSRLLLPAGIPPAASFAWILATGVIALAAGALVMPNTRAWIGQAVARFA